MKSEEVKKKRETVVSEQRAKKTPSRKSNKNTYCKEKEKTHQCRVCDKRFKKTSQLDIHMRCHTGTSAKKFKLFFVNNHNVIIIETLKKFFFNSLFSGEKPYKCEKCDRSYAHNYGLITHMLTTHSALSYTCNICGDAFEKFGELIEHRKSTNHSGKFIRIF